MRGQGWPQKQAGTGAADRGHCWSETCLPLGLRGAEPAGAGCGVSGLRGQPVLPGPLVASVFAATDGVYSCATTEGDRGTAPRPAVHGGPHRPAGASWLCCREEVGGGVRGGLPAGEGVLVGEVTGAVCPLMGFITALCARYLLNHLPE